MLYLIIYLVKYLRTLETTNSLLCCKHLFKISNIYGIVWRGSCSYKRTQRYKYGQRTWPLNDRYERLVAVTGTPCSYNCDITHRRQVVFASLYNLGDQHRYFHGRGNLKFHRSKFDTIDPNPLTVVIWYAILNQAQCSLLIWMDMHVYCCWNIIKIQVRTIHYYTSAISHVSSVLLYQAIEMQMIIQCFELQI